MAWEENTMDYPQFDYSKTVMGALGIEMLEFSPERVVAVMPVTWKTHNPYGTLHGGVSVVMAETVASAGREEIVCKMVDLFSDRTGINLDQVFFIALVPFEDFAQINPDYTRNIMFAYSKGLLKGRGDNLMHPKDDLTYAEALVLTSRLESMIAAEAFYVDAELVKQEENIKFDFKLVNRSGESQDLTFASGQIYEVVVTDRLGQEVYRYSDNTMFTQAIVAKTLAAGEFLSGQVVWDMKDKSGQLLPPGRYSVQISFIPMESGGPDNNSLSAILSFTI
jgi:hypothetical protein